MTSPAGSARAAALLANARRFVDECVIPSEFLYERQLVEGGRPHSQPPIMEELKSQARQLGLWNLFLNHGPWGGGLSVSEYAPIAAIASESPLGLESMNCSAPDTGNMELLALFGNPLQQERWLQPLLDGKIRSSFAMTEPHVASSDPRNLESRIDRHGDRYVLTGHKWWASGALDDRCRLILFVGNSEEGADPYRCQSIMLVPTDAPGVKVARGLTVFGYTDKLGHAEIDFNRVELGSEGLLGEPGGGFMMAQARLGPGRVHYAMRAIGMAERALALMCRRADSRQAFGGALSDKGVVQDWVARSRIDIDQARMLVMNAARIIDEQGNKAARVEVAKVKVAALAAASAVVDRAVQVFGAAGVSDDFPLARMYTTLRALRIADGPDEVHLRTIARAELRNQAGAYR